MIRKVALNMVTPFSETNEVDFEKLEKLLNRQIDENIGSIVLGRSTGEFFSMSDMEIVELVKYVAEKIKDICTKKNMEEIPLVVHTGFNDTRRSIELSIRSKMAGADALILSAPYCNAGNEQGIINHFNAIAYASSIPCYIENDPDNTGINLDYTIIKEIAQNDNIVGIIDSSKDINQMIHLCMDIKEGFEVICSDDSSVIPFMAMGSTSFISTFSNICPNVMKRIYDACMQKDYMKAIIIEKEYLKLMDALKIEVNPIPLKTAMNMLGHDVGEFRMPLHYMDADNAAVLATMIMDMGIKRI